MNFQQRFTLYFFLYVALSSSGLAQVVHFPDPNLRAAVAEVIGVNPDHITVAALRQLERLDAVNREIENLVGLQHVPNLRLLDLSGNRISDLTPLANLRNLEELVMIGNDVTDISPLSGLASLRILVILDNPILDYSPADNLSLDHFIYDQACEMPPLPLAPRLENRTFPSVAQVFGGFWGSGVENQPHLSEMEKLALSDIFVSPLTFHHGWFNVGDIWQVRGRSGEGEEIRDEFLALNPNMIFIAEVRIKTAYDGHVPEDSPYWTRHPSGERVREDDHFDINLTNPVAQEIIIAQALAIERCGLYDGIFFDHWAEDEDDPLAKQQARDHILERIRAEARPDFLIMGNTNDRKIPRTASDINGGMMETLLPQDKTGEHLESGLLTIRDSLSWLEANLREPHVNIFEGWGVPTEPKDGPVNLRWMRYFTTLSLTHSDGYVLLTDGTGHGHFWYDFWDVDLGQPIGEKSQLYENTEGLYIREFTNGWAVHNHSGEAQVITLPEEVQGAATGLVNTEHELPNLDGEMYLRAKPRNPADVNGDGVVNIFDLTLVAQAMGTDKPEADVNGDGVVNVFDLVFVANQF